MDPPNDFDKMGVLLLILRHKSKKASILMLPKVILLSFFVYFEQILVAHRRDYD